MGYGTGGVGKTYTLDNPDDGILQQRKLIEYDPELDMETNSDEYDYFKATGKPGSREIQKMMYKHRNKLIIFDDCDSMWDDPGIINVLKGALDTSGQGKVQWAQAINPPKDSDEEAVPAVFRFTGRMMFITNLSKAELVAKGASPITESRAASTDLSMNLEQTLERIETKIIPKMSLKDDKGEKLADLTLEDKQAAFEAFKEVAQFGKIEQINTRVYGGIVAKARYQRRMEGKYDKEMLKKYFLQQFGL